MANQVDLLSGVTVVYIVLPVRLLPCLSLEGYREATRHLNRFADWEIRGGLVVEESQYLVIEIDGC